MIWDIKLGTSECSWNLGQVGAIIIMIVHSKDVPAATLYFSVDGQEHDSVPSLPTIGNFIASAIVAVVQSTPYL